MFDCEEYAVKGIENGEVLNKEGAKLRLDSK
jgi:hypothetical protein